METVEGAEGFGFLGKDEIEVFLRYSMERGRAYQVKHRQRLGEEEDVERSQRATRDFVHGVDIGLHRCGPLMVKG